MSHRLLALVAGAVLVLCQTLACSQRPEVGDACFSDFDCQSTQVCDPNGACADLVASQSGAACSTDAECPAGARTCDLVSGQCFKNVTVSDLAPNCSSLRDCAMDESCVLGTCVLNSPSTCFSDSDCPTGSSCANGSCSVP